MSKKEIAQRGDPEQEEAETWWAYSRQAARALRGRQAPPNLPMHGLVMRRGERVYLHASALHWRFYGGSGQYSTTGMIALGRPAFVLGSMAASGLVNHSRRKAAERDAVTSWRDFAHLPVVVTSQRLMCLSPINGWQTFDFSVISEFYPDLADWSMVVAFSVDAPPLRLAGPAAPALALWTAVGVLGEDWEQDPRLAPLLV